MRSCVYPALILVTALVGCKTNRCHGPQCAGRATVYAPPPAQWPLRVSVPKQIEEPVSRPVEAPVARPRVETRPVSTEVEDGRYAHASDYSWLTGRLQRVHVPGGEWKIRYAPLSEMDQWGGSMVLAPDVRLDSFSDGDFVRIEGEILTDRPSLYLSGALYRIRTVEQAGEQPDAIASEKPGPTN